MPEQSAAPPGPMFDEDSCQRLKDCFSEIMLAHPEVRSLSASIDYHGSLNDSPSVHRAVWLGHRGVVTEPDEIFGSLMSTLRLAAEQFDRALRLVDHLREQVQLLGIEITEHVTEKSDDKPL